MDNSAIEAQLSASSRAISSESDSAQLSGMDAMLFATEDELSASFIRSTQPDLWTRQSDCAYRAFSESSCSEGRADWVWAAVPGDWPERSAETAGLLQQPTCSRILAALKPSAPRSEQFVSTRAGVTTVTLRRWIGELREAGLIDEPKGGMYVLGPNFTIPELEIVAFEFKLLNWRRAFAQAKRYRTFSHRVFVVMPAPTASRVGDACGEQFRRFGVGLMGHAPDGTSTVVISARKRLPHSRHNFIRAVGTLIMRPECRPAPETDEAPFANR